MKSDLSQGYVVDVSYSHGYFHELAPSYLRFFLLVNGYGCPSDGADYSYCELGYGQGVSANIHAAAHPRGEFWGTDFNSGHALHARSLARQGGLNAHWLDLDFEAFADADTPQFDFITLHGVWSWVGAAAQHALVEFIRRKLKPGGAVFISYNIQPGWSAEKPLRDLLWLHTQHAGAPGAPTAARIANALKFADALRQHGSEFFAGNATAGKVLDGMLRKEPGQLAHEYFNQSWWLTHFAEVERSLQAAHLGYACSLHRLDLLGAVRERLKGAGFLDPALGTALRETSADFLFNRRFRRDVFVRGGLRLLPAQRLARLDEVAFVLLRPAGEVGKALGVAQGANLGEETRAGPLVRMLDCTPHPISLKTLRTSDECASWSSDEVVDILARLVARRDIGVVFPDDAARAGESRAIALNTAIVQHAVYDNSLRFMASPVAGCGVETSHFDRLLCLAWQQGARGAAQIARDALALFGGKQVLCTSSGDEVDADAARQEFERLAGRFVDEVMPRWRRLGMLEVPMPEAAAVVAATSAQALAPA